MPKLTTVSKVIITAAVVAVLIVLVVLYGNGSSRNSIVENNGSSSAALTAVSPAATATTTSPAQAQKPVAAQTNGGVPAVRRSPPATVIHFVTPVANDIWVITTQNIISWDKPGGITGSLSLLDATTKAFIGVVLPQVGPDQTSYTWNTRDLLLARTNPFKKDVAPGSYILQLTYDGNNIQPATSPVFKITN